MRRCDIPMNFTMRKPSFQEMLAVAALIMLCFAVEQGDARCPMAELMTSSTGPRRTLKQVAAPPPASTTQYVNPPLQFGFYDQTCPSLNQIVSNTIGMYSALDTLTPAKVLRLFFHDCFAQGCDASILLNSTAANLAEKDQTKSVFLDKYGVVDAIKAAAEAACPGIVSCADILALAAVTAVYQAGGPLFAIELGRRDGLTSYAFSASTNIPAGTLKLDGLMESFLNVGLDQTDLVALSGSHTIGEVHCINFADRYQAAANSPFIDAALGQELYSFCTQNGTYADFAALNLKTFLDVQSPSTFDNSYFVNLMAGRGILTSDQDLYNDLRTQALVQAYAFNGTMFFNQFIDSMRRMGKINVLTGTQGQIRQQCWVRNNNATRPNLDLNPVVAPFCKPAGCAATCAV